VKRFGIIDYIILKVLDILLETESVVNIFHDGNNLYFEEPALSHEDMDMHMLDIKNHMTSMVDERCDGKDRDYAIIHYERSKKYSMVFSKEKDTHSIGIEHEFFVEYIVCGKKNNDIEYIIVPKEFGKRKESRNYKDNPELVFNKSLTFLSTLCLIH